MTVPTLLVFAVLVAVALWAFWALLVVLPVQIGQYYQLDFWRYRDDLYDYIDAHPHCSETTRAMLRQADLTLEIWPLMTPAMFFCALFLNPVTRMAGMSGGDIEVTAQEKRAIERFTQVRGRIMFKAIFFSSPFGWFLSLIVFVLALWQRMREGVPVKAHMRRVAETIGNYYALPLAG